MSIYIKAPKETKPCPFCGSTDIEIRVNDEQEPLFLTCNECNAEGPQNGLERNFEAELNWNKRF
jgi:Lar family restriction alleviation protein